MESNQSPIRVEEDATQLELELPGLPAEQLPLWQRKLWPIVTLIMLLVGGIVGWRVYTALRSSQTATSNDSEQSQSPVRLPVKTVRAELAPIQRWVTSPDSEVQVSRYKQLMFETSGEITYLKRVNGRYLRTGDYVQQGQLLATIDDRRYDSNIRSTKAELEVSRRNKNQSIASLNQSKANLEQAKADLALAKTEAKRRQTLFDQGILPATEIDTYNNRVVQAQVAVKVARSNIQSAQDQVAASQANISASAARLNNQVIAKEDTQLISPINGMVAYLNIREGEYWNTQRVRTNSYQDAIETVPIVIVDPSQFEVVLELPAAEGSLIKPNQRAYIALDNDISKAFVQGLTQKSLVSVAKAEGQVFSVTPAVTPGGRAIRVRIRITSGVDKLRLGERVQTWITAQSRDAAITLPFGAVKTRNRQSYVFVVNESTNTVEQRPVQLDIEGLDRISIASGLQPGDLIVTEGSNRLVNGSPVEVISSSPLLK